MAVTVLTASLASGYLTNVQYISMGNKRAFSAHFSAPAGTSQINPGFVTISFGIMDGSDSERTHILTDGKGQAAVLFSGCSAGDTGYIMIVN